MSKLPLLVIVPLAECGTGEPRTLSQTSNSITLRWWSDKLADAAGNYCTRMGRAAEMISIERDGSPSIGHYCCV
jgi:hypothetical protein